MTETTPKANAQGQSQPKREKPSPIDKAVDEFFRAACFVVKQSKKNGLR